VTIPNAPSWSVVIVSGSFGGIINQAMSNHYPNIGYGADTLGLLAFILATLMLSENYISKAVRAAIPSVLLTVLIGYVIFSAI